MNITCAEGVIENIKEYMQPIANIDDVELALGIENISGKYFTQLSNDGLISIFQ